MDFQKGSERQGGTSYSYRRGEILNVATALFAEHGYKPTTVRMIADAAGILSGSLYHHFPSKETILEEILRRFLTELNSGFRSIVARGRDSGETLTSLIRYSFDVIHESGPEVTLFQSELSMIPRRPEFAAIDDLVKENGAIWMQVIERGQRSGELRDAVDPEIHYRFMRDAIWSTVTWYRPAGGMSPEQLASAFVDTLVHGLWQRPTYGRTDGQSDDRPIAHRA